MYGKRKNNNRYNKKRALATIFVCVLVLFILSVSLVACCYNSTQKIAYADYETDILNNSNAIVNFNQIFNVATIRSSYQNITFSNNNGLISAVGSSSYYNTSLPISDTLISLLANHKYYMVYNFINGNNTNIVRGLRRHATDNIVFNLADNNYGIYEPNANIDVDVLFGITSNYNYNVKFYINLIDLTQMFGANEPNLQQCRELFTANYYNYTTGQPISISGLNSFIEGVNYAYEQLNFDVVNSSAYTTAYIDPSINNSNAFVERYVDLGTNGQYLYLKARGYLSIPLSQTLDQGSVLNFGYTDPGQGGSGNYLYIGILYNNNFIPVMNISTHLTDDTTTNLTMTIPYSTNTIVFVESSTEDYFTFVDSAYWLGDLQVNYAQLDVQVLINSIVSDELRKQKEFYDGYYSYGEGYTKIYNQGLQDGSATGQAFTDSMSFTGSVFHAIGDILSMQVIPNIPLGLFVALPLLVGLLFFIVKIAKGSGG